jgi:hypothetical protein
VGAPALERAHEESDAAVAGEHWPSLSCFGLRGNFLNKINAHVAGTYSTAAKIDICNSNVYAGFWTVISDGFSVWVDSISLASADLSVSGTC